MKNLISVTDFVLEQELELRNYFEYDNREALVKIFNYANFIKQPLELWMFVPCDENGNPLVFDYPQNKAFEDIAQVEFEKQYQQAKERCLFEGFQMYKGNPYNYHKARAFTKDYIEEKWTIEKIIHWELQLTQTAIKQIGL